MSPWLRFWAHAGLADRAYRPVRIWITSLLLACILVPALWSLIYFG